MPQGPSLAIVRLEIINEFDRAEQACRSAEEVTPESRDVEAVGHVKAVAEAHRKREAEK
ncbi:MAG: hypothetical protein ACKOCD_01980 [Nitrospiraceae bacterium]